MLISFLIGAVVSFEMTLRNARAYSESAGIVVFEVYGQEWVYEEQAHFYYVNCGGAWCDALKSSPKFEKGSPQNYVNTSRC